MTYRNKKSGIVFTTSCVCGGEDWEEVKDEKKQESAGTQPGNSGGECREEAKASAPASKAKRGKKQESATDAESSDSDGENS